LLGCLASGQGWNPVDVLVVDGDHHLEGIMQDLRMYGPLVRPGGLILMHDRVPTCFPEVHVWKIWPKLREMYRTSEIGSLYGWGVIHVQEDDDFIARVVVSLYGRDCRSIWFMGLGRACTVK
jgi:hypothetical protein